MIPILGNGSTFASDLKRVGQKMFPNKFSGVFARDRIPKHIIYAIVNLDKHDEKGSHWVALVDTAKLSGSKGELLVYDSFGRDTKKILPNLEGRGDVIIDADDDAEQSINEDNCGARVLSWLYIFDNFGKDIALLI